MFDVSAALVVKMRAVPAAVSLPLVSAVNVGTVYELPKEPAVTPVAAKVGFG